MQPTSEAPTMGSQPLDVYLGFEIHVREDKSYVAVPQAWAADLLQPLQAPDLPQLRTVIWRWWHNLHD